MRNFKPGSRGRVTLGLGSLGWQDRVTLWGEPTFSHTNRFKRVTSSSRSKTRHAEHAQADISVPWEGQLIITRLTFFPYRQGLRDKCREVRANLHLAIFCFCFMNLPANLWNKNKIWPSADYPFVRGIWLIVYAVFHFGFTAPTQAPMFVDLQKPLEVIYGELRNVTVLWKVCYFYSLKCFKRFISNSIKIY